MKPGKEGFRVAVVGASSLLGKELLTTLEEQAFPVSRLVSFEANEEEPDLPIVDLREESQAAVDDRDVNVAELDFAFLAARPSTPPAFLTGDAGSTAAASDTRCTVIDLTGAGFAESLARKGAEPLRGKLSIPFLDRRFPRPGTGAGTAPLIVSAHPAVIVLSTVLLRMAARFPLKTAVAQVFLSASEIGPRAIEELQKQTVNLLSFQKIPRHIFGGQLAFNLLSRLGKSGGTPLSDLEGRLRQELQGYLGGRVPPPALRAVQVPVFFGLAISLYVETVEPVDPTHAVAAIEGERLHVRRASQDSPTQVEVVGSTDILVDGVTADPGHPNGLWLWAVADNIRLAAFNAIEIATSLRARVRT